MNSIDPLTNPINLRCGITIYPSQDKAIDEILAALLEKAPARLILLTDTSGQIVSVQGERGRGNPVAIASLTAADLAASQEMARLTGDYQDNQMIIREGNQTHTIIYEVGKHLILMAHFSNDAPLGWVRHLVRQAAEEIIRIISIPADQLEDIALNLGEAPIQDLIDDALDDLWNG